MTRYAHPGVRQKSYNGTMCACSRLATNWASVSNRLTNVTGRGALYTQAWNVQDWDVKS